MANDLLRHVCQRIDALTYDEHSQYLLGSLRAADAPGTPFSGSGASSVANRPVTAAMTPMVAFGGASAAAGGAISSRRRRAPPGWARVVGLTSYYMRFVLLIGVGWFFAMLEIFAFLYALDNINDMTGELEVLAFTMYFATGAVGCVLFGSLADHYGRRRIMIAALMEWIVTNGLTGIAWSPEALLVLRALASLGLGGQLVLFVTISLEYTPKRTRGRITVISLLLATVGIFTGVWYGHSAIPVLTWRASFAVVSGVALFYVAAIYGWLEESPKYLASIGSSQEAMRVLAVMETAHGIDRQARITVPTSLYAPRPQPLPEHTEQHHSSFDSRQRTLTELYRQPHHADFDEADDDRYKRQMRLDDDRELRGALDIGRGGRSSSRPRRDTNANSISDAILDPALGLDGGASPGLISFAQSLKLRFGGVLLRAPLLNRTLLLWIVWFGMGLSVSSGLAALLIVARIGKKTSFYDQLIWSSMTVPGILIAAVLVERVGRKLTMALFLFGNGAAMTLGAGLLSDLTVWNGFVWLTASLTCTVTGTFGSLCAFTGEQYPLMVRALGLGIAAAWGHLGMFVGSYTVLQFVISKHWTWPELRIVLAVAGGVCLLILVPLAALTGVETKGHDVDTLEWHALNSRKRPHQRHHQAFLETEEVMSRETALHEHQMPHRVSMASSIQSSAMLTAPTTGVRTNRAVSTPAQPMTTTRGGSISEGNTHRSSLPVLMAASSSSTSSAPGPLQSPLSPPAVSLSTSSSPMSSSSSSSSGFWKKRSVHRLRRQVKAVAAAVRMRKTLSVSSTSSTNTKKARTFTGSSRSTTLPSDDLDLLDTIVTDQELNGEYGYEFGRRRTKSGYNQRRRARTVSTGTPGNSHTSRWFVPTLSSESVMSLGRWRNSSSASSASSASSVESLEPPVPRAKRKSTRQSRRIYDPEPVLEIVEPVQFTGSGRFLLDEDEDKQDAHPRFQRRQQHHHHVHRQKQDPSSSSDESNMSIDLDMFDTFTSISTPVGR